MGQGREVCAELDAAVVPDDCLALQDLNYDATISSGLPYEPEDSQYGESRLIRLTPGCSESIQEHYRTDTLTQ